jgi:class 3 adenylate cyclase
VGEFTREELARRAGVDVGFLDRLVEHRVVSGGEDDTRFTRADIRRARFVFGLERGGVPLDAVGAAIRSGALSLAFFDAGYWDRFGGLATKTYRVLSDETGLSLDLLLAVRESMGFARPEPDDPVREDELVVIPLLRTLIAIGADPVVLERHIRIWGESLRRIAEADGNFYRSQIEAPLLEAGLSWSDMVRAASDASEAMVPFLDPALLSMYHAQSEHTWLANVVEAVEASLENAGLHRSISRPPAMCFLDLSGFTRLTEERGDEAAAEMSAALGTLVQRASHGRGGRPVKSLGDGVMVYFRDPGAGVLFALAMQEEIPAADLPQVHVGIAAGTVVFQDGDYFGRTVNLASRIAAHATAGQVLVNAEVANATTDPLVEFVDLGSVELKGVSQPVRIHEARRRA